jgi:putative salt-induced outer membrane protein YdiY
MRNYIIYLAVYLFCLPIAADADQVYLINGDRLTGTIAQLEDGKITIKTELLGNVEIVIENIQTFSSDDPLEMLLRDGTVVNQPVRSAPQGSVQTTGGESIPPQTVALSQIKSFYPSTPRWEGDISIAMTHTTGNTKTESLSGSANLSKRTKNDRTTLGGDYARRDEEESDEIQSNTTEDWMKLRGKYAYFLTQKFYLFGEGRYERDRIADLDSRTVLGGGGGYQWIESNTTNFATELGLAAVQERYSGVSSHETDFSGQAGYHFDHRFNSIFQLMHDLTYYPALADPSDYYLSSSAEIRAAMSKNMFANFKFLFDYDATPAESKGSTDVKYLLGVGYKF